MSEPVLSAFRVRRGARAVCAHCRWEVRCGLPVRGGADSAGGGDVPVGRGPALGARRVVAPSGGTGPGCGSCGVDAAGIVVRSERGWLRFTGEPGRRSSPSGLGLRARRQGPEAGAGVGGWRSLPVTGGRGSGQCQRCVVHGTQPGRGPGWPVTVRRCRPTPARRAAGVWFAAPPLPRAWVTCRGTDPACAGAPAGSPPATDGCHAPAVAVSDAGPLRSPRYGSSPDRALASYSSAANEATAAGILVRPERNRCRHPLRRCAGRCLSAAGGEAG